MKILGLIGKTLKHSFSRDYFTKKFKDLGLKDFEYKNFELKNINEFPTLIENEKNLIGLNVTIPYKEQIIPFLDRLSAEAQQIKAVNTIKIKNGQLIGYNTDIYGFQKSLLNFIDTTDLKALILGTGGAAKAVAYILKNLKIDYFFVSRRMKNFNTLLYSDLNKSLLKAHRLIINTTPVGMFPNTDACPDIPYEFINSEHYFYDLIYNPQETLFLKKAKQKGAKVKNGFEMLILQAEKSWEIFITD